MFPSSPWLFLFRDPYEVLASACPQPASGCHLGALGGRAVTETDVSKCASSEQHPIPILHPQPTPCTVGLHILLPMLPMRDPSMYLTSLMHQNGFRYLKTLMGRGVMTLRDSHAGGDRLGMAVDYSTLSTVLASDVDVILGHLQLSASTQERAAMAEVLGYDIKASKKQKGLVPFDRAADAARKKAVVEANPKLLRIFSALDPVYTELLQLTVPMIASPLQGPTAPSSSVQNPKEGGRMAQMPSWQADPHTADNLAGSQNGDDPDKPRRGQRSSPAEEHLVLNNISSRTMGWGGRLAAAAAMTHPEPGGVASEKQPGNSFGTEVTFVAPGMFDEPLYLYGEGQHGRASSECNFCCDNVRALVLKTLLGPLQCPLL